MQKIFGITLLLGFAFLFIGSSVFAAQECETYCIQVSAEVQKAQQEKRDPVLPAQPQGFSCICNPLQAKQFTDLINSILKIIFNIALAIVPLMVVIGGFMFVSAGGKPEQVAKARNLLLWTAVGFVVILSARGLVKVLEQLLNL